MNNYPTLRRLVMLFLAFPVLLAWTNRVSAQCTISFVPPQPVSVNLELDNTGFATLDASTLPTIGFTPSCALEFSQDPLFLTSYPDVLFDCGDLSAPNTCNTWYVRANDGVQFSATVQLCLTITDNLDPVFNTCAADQTVSTALNQCTGGWEDIETSVTDNCGSLLLTWTLSGATTGNGSGYLESFDVLNIGTTTVTYLATDASGNTATCSFDVTVEDNELPDITCPTPLATYSTDPDICTRYNSFEATVTDNCPGFLVEWDAPGATPTGGSITDSPYEFTATFEIGTTTVTFKVTDVNGNTDECTFDVVVVDEQIPDLECPEDMTVYMDNNCEYTVGGGLFDAVSSDNCDPSLNTFNNINGLPSIDGHVFTVSDIGTFTVEWTAEDDASPANIATCDFQVTLADTTRPVVGAFVLPLRDMIMVNVTPGDCSSAVTFNRPSNEANGGPTVTDNCIAAGPVVITEGIPVVNGVPQPNLFDVIPAYDPTIQQNLNTATVQFSVGTTVIPYTWTDQYGNATTKTITVIVKENENPVAKCKPGIVTLPLAINGKALLTPDLVNDGSSDNCGIDSLRVTSADGVQVSNNTEFDCNDLATNKIYTLTVFDATGNSHSCTGTVDIVDNTAPVANCPTNISVPAGAGCQTLGSDISGLTLSAVSTVTGPGQYTDNCGVTSITYSIVNPNLSIDPTDVYANIGAKLFQRGTSVVTFTFKDAANLSAVCSFNVTVQDVTAPTYTGNVIYTDLSGSKFINDTIFVNANAGGCLAQVSWTPPQFTDNCTPANITVTSNYTPGQFFNFGKTPVIYTAIDAAGNINNDTFYIKVVDTQAPVAKCKPFTIQLPDIGGIFPVSLLPDSINDNSTDNCFYTLSVSKSTFDCSNIGTNVVTLTVKDGQGNTKTCTANVFVKDTVDPKAFCTPAAVILPLSATVPNGAFLMNATVLNDNSVDNCTASGALILQVSRDGGATYAATANFTCSDIPSKVVTFRVTDAQGNSSTCTKTVSIIDNLAPVGVPPATANISCTQLPYASDLVSFSDNSQACILPTRIQLADITVNPPTCANTYTIIRTWQVTDGYGNTSTTTQIINVVDNVKPVFAVKSAINAGLPNSSVCVATLNYVLTADSLSDNCSSFANISKLMSINYPAGPGNPADIGSIAIPVGYDANLLKTFPIGTTTVTFLAVDQCGNSTSKQVVITVADDKAPVFGNGFQTTCGLSVVKNNTPGSCSNTHTWQRPFGNNVLDCKLMSVTEEISDPTVAPPAYDYFNPTPISAIPTAQFPVGLTTVKYTAKDTAGNTATCQFTVEIIDNQSPQLICPNAVQILPATCEDAEIPDYRNLILISDNCSGNVVLTQTPAQETTLDEIFGEDVPTAGDEFVITITGEDGYNTTNCNFTIRLTDGDKPIPSLAVLPMLVDSCGGLLVPAPTADDACNPNATTIYGTPSTPVGTFVPGTPPQYNLTPGNYVITWVYNDGNGNISTQPQNITIYPDTFPPVALCEYALTVPLDATGVGTITATQIDSLSFDPNDCGPITFSLSKSSFNCSNLGLNTVVFTAKDHKNNTATCTTRITVKDVTPPVLSIAPKDTLIMACAAIPAPATLTASDACDVTLPVTLKADTVRATGALGKYTYTITRRWTVSDDSGNSSTATQIITVKDTLDPVFLATLPDTLVFETATNNIDCKAEVKVKIGNFVTDCATGADLRVTSSPAAFSLNDSLQVLMPGVHTYTFTAKDTSGNTSTKVVKIILKDATLPVAACINGVSISLQASGTVVVSDAQVNANSFDNCSPKDSLDLKVQRLDPNGVPIDPPSDFITFTCPDGDAKTQHRVQLFVKDKAGNESMCQTYIVVQDNVKPTITSCPASKAVDCTLDLDPAQNNNGIAVAVDNCPASVMIVHKDTLLAGTGLFCQQLVRTWTAKDIAGNTATCVQTFSIRDTIAPVFSSLPADATISCSDPLVTAPTLTATDNCSLADSVKITYTQIKSDTVVGLCGQYSFTMTRTWTAKDKCGNTRVHTQKIKVSDTQKPQFLGLPDTISVFSANFQNDTACNVPILIDLRQYLTDCTPDDKLIVTHNFTQYAPNNDTIKGNFPIGTYNLILSATDLCGNNGKDTVVLRAIDNSIPTVVCNDKVVVALGTNSTATLTTSDIELDAKDNCGIATRVLAPTSFNCSNIGINKVTLTVTDVNGNSNACTVDVQVTQGNNPGLMTTTVDGAESYFGAKDGAVSVSASNGSGNYSYAWGTGDTTSSISNLAPGLYPVTVTDAGTTCKRLDTATVVEGAKITIIVGAAAGAQDAIVRVPVTAQRFKNIYAFKFSAHVINPSVGTILGVDSLNAALTGLTPSLTSTSDLRILFTKVDSITLPDNALLFNIRVKLGTASVGSTSPLTIDGIPVPIEFLQGRGSGPTVTPIVATNGSVTINANANDRKVGGLIATWRAPEKPVPGVTVTLGGTVTATQTTAAAGTYSFIIPTNGNSSVDCSKTTAGNAQITAADLLLIQNYIFGAPLPSPYQWVAADVDGNGMITLLDYVRISSVVLGTNQHIPGSADWKFIPKSYTFPSPNPLTVAPPTSINRTGVTTDVLNDDFVAVRMGDVNGNITPAFAGGEVEDRSSETFRFRLEDRSFKAGELVSVPFKAGDFRNRQAYQMTIAFDPDVFELHQIETGALKGLKEENFGTAHLADGHLTTLWVSTTPVSVDDDEVLFTLTFKALRKGAKLSNVLAPGSQVTAAEAYDWDGKPMRIDFEFIQPENGGESNTFALFQNQPNPFHGTTTIGFRLPESTRATMRVFNSNGQLVRTLIGEYMKGYNEVNFIRDELGAPGVYYYELETPKFSDRKKMILVD